jgi:hypothetical protein
MMMCSRCWPAVVLSLLVACAVAPGEATTSSDEVSVNRITGNRITGNRIELGRLSLGRLAGTRLSDRRMRLTPVAQPLLATEDGRELLSLVVSCAVPLGITLVGTVNGVDFDLLGEIGLAPQWLSTRLERVGQHWVSACMFSRVNALEVVIPISMRGPHRELATVPGERESWTLEEGAFYGNAFSPLDRPLQWFACRGRDKAAGNAGRLVDRVCADPDPANPGFTRCGMIFAGDCGNFARDQSCEAFSGRGTFYERCHTSPLRHHHGHDQDHGRNEDQGHDRDDDDDDAQVFEQVITTFVTH